MARLNQDGKDLDLRAAASQRYRQRQAKQRTWVNEIAEHLGVDPYTLISNSAHGVAELIRTQGTQ